MQIGCYVVDDKSSKAKNDRDTSRWLAHDSLEELPPPNIEFDGFTFRVRIYKSDDIKEKVQSLADDLKLEAEHIMYFDEQEFIKDVPKLMRWSQKKSTKYLNYVGYLRFRSGWARVYAPKGKYANHFYISIGGMYQYSDKKVNLIDRINRNIDKRILAIRLERAGIELYSYELACDYNMAYPYFTHEYLHCFTDGDRNKKRIYTKTKHEKIREIESRDDILRGTVYLGKSKQKYLYDKTLKNGLEFDLTRYEIKNSFLNTIFIDEQGGFNSWDNKSTSYLIRFKKHLIETQSFLPQYAQKEVDFCKYF